MKIFQYYLQTKQDQKNFFQESSGWALNKCFKLSILATVPMHHSRVEKGDRGKSQAWHTNQQCGHVLKIKGID